MKSTTQEKAVIPRRKRTARSGEWGVEQVIGQIQMIQSLMKDAMVEDEHYGTIPGCGTKKVLLKPGAEKLGLMFRLAPKYTIDRYELQDGHREYEVTCTLTHIPTGQIWGEGVGTCSTMESKFRYRKAERVCPECGVAAIIKGKAEYGGGWLCYKKKGGCGAKWNDGAEEIEGQEVGKIENENLADQYNTVKKIAKKRALVDATLTATAASDIFTQDIADPEIENVTIISETTIKPVEPKKEKKIEEPKAEKKKTNAVVEGYLKMISECDTLNTLSKFKEENKAEIKKLSKADKDKIGRAYNKKDLEISNKLVKQ